MKSRGIRNCKPHTYVDIDWAEVKAQYVDGIVGEDGERRWPTLPNLVELYGISLNKISKTSIYDNPTWNKLRLAAHGPVNGKLGIKGLASTPKRAEPEAPEAKAERKRQRAAPITATVLEARESFERHTLLAAHDAMGKVIAAWGELDPTDPKSVLKASMLASSIATLHKLGRSAGIGLNQGGAGDGLAMTMADLADALMRSPAKERSPTKAQDQGLTIPAD